MGRSKKECDVGAEARRERVRGGAGTGAEGVDGKARMFISELAQSRSPVSYTRINSAAGGKFGPSARQAKGPKVPETKKLKLRSRSRADAPTPARLLSIIGYILSV